MSILNKLMDTMRLTENDDDYFDEEDYEDCLLYTSPSPRD